jgi:hypothetical protein
MEFDTQESGIKTLNSISKGSDGALFYTLVQHLRFEGVEEGSEEEQEKAVPFSVHGPDAVAATIQKLEELASEGKLS